MFTGLIREVGTVTGLRPRAGGTGLALRAPALAPDVRPGDSICVDGACLTAEEIAGEGFTAYASRETLRTSTLSSLRTGDRVNLEPALRASDRLGGHIVQGHVEGVAEVVGLAREGEAAALAVKIPPDLAAAVVPKGSVALAGISLTVAAIDGERLTVAVVPATLGATTLPEWRSGRRVNIETDVLGRYVAKYLEGVGLGRGLTVDDLVKRGF